MDIGPGTDADLLQQALDGEQVRDPGILELVAVIHAVAAVDQSALAPSPEFVSDLRTRLLEEPTETATDAPSVVRVGAHRLRQLVAAAAAVVLLAGGLGVASRQAAPGDLLYPVKQMLDRAAVRLVGSDLDKGLTHLAQARQHIGEARDLVDRGHPAPSDLATALDAATQSTRSAQAILLEVYRTEQRPEALTELVDFFIAARPQVEALRSHLPADAVPAWERLHDLLAAGELQTLRELAACTVCGDRADAARAALDAGAVDVLATLPGGVSPGEPASPPAPPVSLTGTPAPDGGAVVAPPAATIGSATVGLPQVQITSTAVSGGGGGITLPSATVGLPTLGVSSTVGLGGGGITLPGATLTAPGVSLPLDPTLP